jgi:hypothetical protein
MIQELRNRMTEAVAALDDNIMAIQVLRADIESEERQLAREKAKCADLIKSKADQLVKIMANGNQAAPAEGDKNASSAA